jgi:peroxiredoxin family protein
VTPPAYSLAAVVSTGDLERFYSGMSVLVSTAADGEQCAALAAFSGLAIMLDDDLYRRAQEPETTPSLSWAGRETFASSLLELRDTALQLEALTIYACSASVETMSATPLAVEERLAGVMSTPRFLRETQGATFLFV